MADFYEMDFMKGIVILVKVDEMYNILNSASHCLLVERWDVYYVSPIIKGRLHFVRDTAAEKEFDSAIKMTSNYLIRRSKKIEIDENSNI